MRRNNPVTFITRTESVSAIERIDRRREYGLTVPILTEILRREKRKAVRSSLRRAIAEDRETR